jgi:nitrite reductase (NADH) small subunit
MTRHIVSDEADFPDGSAKIVSVHGLEIGVYRLGGKYYALLNRCPHEGGPVCKGMVTGTLVQGKETGWKLKWTREGEILYCPWHGSDFDLTNGRCLSRDKLRIRTYPTKVVDGKVIIET